MDVFRGAPQGPEDVVGKGLQRDADWDSGRLGHSLQPRCRVSATPGFKQSGAYPQASNTPNDQASQLIWGLSSGCSSASPCLMQAGTSSAAVTQI